MVKNVSPIEKVEQLLEMIQFKLTIFALPFALTGAFLASQGVPGFWKLCWIILAMIGARTSAMGFNRIVDRSYDKDNPRTADRAIPKGEVSLAEAWSMVILAGFFFFFACFMLNRLTLILAPFCLFLTFFYSVTKRFTFLCHFILGAALACAPFGGWVAVQGSFADYPWALSLGVIFWVAGFDTIYGCLDAKFDRQAGLHSLPAKIGSRNSFRVAGVFHFLSFVFFALAGVQADLNIFYYLGIILASIALFYQHILVRPDDLSRIRASFFSMNGFISITIFIATWISLTTLY